MRILLIEDDDEKADRITEYLKTAEIASEVKLARSVNSGLKELVRSGSGFDWLLLDMSMPNFDASDPEISGDDFERFAGKDLLAQMLLRRITTPTIVVTMFDSFGSGSEQISLSELDSELKKRFRPVYRGLVHFSSAQEGWQLSLKKLLIGGK